MYDDEKFSDEAKVSQISTNSKYFLAYLSFSLIFASKSWFWKLRQICLQVGVPHPLEWLSSRPSKLQVKSLCELLSNNTGFINWGLNLTPSPPSNTWKPDTLACLPPTPSTGHVVPHHGRWRRAPLRQGCCLAGQDWKPWPVTGFPGTGKAGVLCPCVGALRTPTGELLRISFSPALPC